MASLSLFGCPRIANPLCLSVCPKMASIPTTDPVYLCPRMTSLPLFISVPEWPVYPQPTLFACLSQNGRYPLDADGYEQIFSNFLLGGTPHGPGRHIFGCFEHSVSKTPFRLIQPAPEPDDSSMDVKILMEKRPKRMSLTPL